MKTYRVEARYTMHCYLDVEAESEEEAWDIAMDTDGADFIPDMEKDATDDSWEIYNVEEK